MRLPALFLILTAVLWRVLAIHAPELANFSPLMALTFCGGVYFRGWQMWLAPFFALSLSDLYIDRVYAVEFHYQMGWGTACARLACFAAGLGIGLWVARRRSWLSLLNGALGASLLFYFVTNSFAWIGDAGYAHNAAGWWQAMTVGHPQFAPTIFFFRNTFFSDLLFTGFFAVAMECAALRRGEASLLGAAKSKI